MQDDVLRLFGRGPAALAASAPLQSAPEALIAHCGIYDGTLIGTVHGWRRVEHLRPGDRVLTLDSGPVRLAALVENTTLARPALRADWPRLVPEGVLGNRGPLKLSPRQGVMVESDLAPPFSGDRFALLPTTALDGYRGIAPEAPEPGLKAWSLRFEREEIVLTAGDALLHCPKLGAPSTMARYSCLSAVAAAGLLALMTMTS